MNFTPKAIRKQQKIAARAAPGTWIIEDNYDETFRIHDTYSSCIISTVENAAYLQMCANTHMEALDELVRLQKALRHLHHHAEQESPQMKKIAEYVIKNYHLEHVVKIREEDLRDY